MIDRRRFLAWMGIAPIAAPAAVKAAAALPPDMDTYDFGYTTVRTSIPAGAWRKLNMGFAPSQGPMTLDEWSRRLSDANASLDDDLPNVYDDEEDDL